jgi:TRAP-type C4-dicarboxylate transport system permease small subunit
MNTIRIAALALIVAGVLALAYGGFSYTKQTHQAKLGPLELSVKETETVNIPLWVGLGAIVIGGVLLVAGKPKG